MPDSEFLLEVRCEEIPARMLEPAIRQLASRLFEQLLASNVAPGEVQTGFTPRRLMVLLKGVPEREPDRAEVKMGPPVAAAFDQAGKPTAAATGFAKKCGIRVEDLERVENEKGEYVVAEHKIEGRPTIDVLSQVVPQILRDLDWAKTMRWGSGDGPWVRPVHSLIALFGGNVVPFELFGVTSGDSTAGHPVLSPQDFAVKGGSDYRRKMSRRGIEVRFEARKKKLLEQMNEAADGLGGELVEDAALLAKLASICGIPGVIVGRFDPTFLTLPREVLITSLRDHQSAFTLESDGKLLSCFLTVMDRPDDPAGSVQAGNEWVVEARLADAKFFYEEDKKTSLADRRAGLDQLVFHARLGSYADKTARITQLSEVLCQALGWEKEQEAVAQAAELLKLDLTTEMVKEFTSLQGVMGGIYAREEGLPEPVWQAIYDQYLPASTDDPIPRSPEGQLTAIADRVDTLVGIFGLGLIPTGSRDPFGLRRAAQAVVRILLEGDLSIDLDLVAAQAVLLYGDRLEKSGEEILTSLRPFFHDRVRYLLGLEGYDYDSIEAALAVGSSSLPDLRSRVDALHSVRQESDFLAVVLAAKRIANIIKEAPEQTLREDLLKEEAEKNLYRASRQLRSEIEAAEAAGDYESGFRHIAEFADVLDDFFVKVLVMDENRDLRFNRIALLQSIHRTISRAARLTEIVVDKAELRGRNTDMQVD
ncbi:MAG: glycine--tRNA ligase subunit beta [Acidobacteria bacterium]|nr:MAG: glycine--tRNA ligase subunit beta [Acidobacteriota bacterium]